MYIYDNLCKISVTDLFPINLHIFIAFYGTFRCCLSLHCSPHSWKRTQKWIYPTIQTLRLKWNIIRFIPSYCFRMVQWHITTYYIELKETLWVHIFFSILCNYTYTCIGKSVSATYTISLCKLFFRQDVSCI